jgi:hypothetical protein
LIACELATCWYVILLEGRVRAIASEPAYRGLVKEVLSKVECRTDQVGGVPGHGNATSCSASIPSLLHLASFGVLLGYYSSGSRADRYVWSIGLPFVTPG